MPRKDSPHKPTSQEMFPGASRGAVWQASGRDRFLHPVSVSVCVRVCACVLVISIVCDYLFCGCVPVKGVRPPLFFVSEQVGKSCSFEVEIVMISSGSHSLHRTSDLQFLTTDLKVVFTSWKLSFCIVSYRMPSILYQNPYHHTKLSVIKCQWLILTRGESWA